MPQLETPVLRDTGPVIIPPLENGDRLSSAEFERRYEAMPNVKKAELIRGVVHMPSPVSTLQHAHPHSFVMGWLNFYVVAAPFLIIGDNGTIRLGDNDVPQPDAFLLIPQDRGGKARFDARGYTVGGPELVAEVASSSVSIDLHSKFDMYAEHGIQEYVVWRVLENAVDWFSLDGKQYQRLALGSDGIYRSRVFPGLWLDPLSWIARDLRRVHEVVQQGIATPEHAAFVRRLEKLREVIE